MPKPPGWDKPQTIPPSAASPRTNMPTQASASPSKVPVKENPMEAPPAREVDIAEALLSPGTASTGGTTSAMAVVRNHHTSAATPRATDAPQSPSQHLTNLTHQPPEQRVAADGQAYSYIEFLEHYGSAKCFFKWQQAAQKEDPATQHTNFASDNTAKPMPPHTAKTLGSDPSAAPPRTNVPTTATASTTPALNDATAPAESGDEPNDDDNQSQRSWTREMNFQDFLRPNTAQYPCTEECSVVGCHGPCFRNHHPARLLVELYDDHACREHHPSEIFSRHVPPPTRQEDLDMLFQTGDFAVTENERSETPILTAEHVQGLEQFVPQEAGGYPSEAAADPGTAPAESVASPHAADTAQTPPIDPSQNQIVLAPAATAVATSHNTTGDNDSNVLLRLRQEDAAGLRDLERHRIPRRSLHNLAREALNTVTETGSPLPESLDLLFPWQEYIACHARAEDIIGSGITSATVEAIEGTADPNRRGQPRIHFIIYRRDGTCCRIHPGTRKGNDAKLLFYGLFFGTRCRILPGTCQR